MAAALWESTFGEDIGFWAKVDIRGPNDCWLWTKGRTGSKAKNNQYGRTRYLGKADTAHRVAYTLARGPIPDGLHILHGCDVPLCCNPEHLRVGTHAENMQEKVERNRARGWPAGIPRKPIHPNTEK